MRDLAVVGEGVVRDWAQTRDAQHFGAGRELSCESYIEPYGACRGNARVTIRTNRIHRVPSALFFKNPAPGPFEVVGNVVHDVQHLGHWSGSNITFQENLVYRSRGGANVGASAATPVRPCTSARGATSSCVATRSPG